MGFLSHFEDAVLLVQEKAQALNERLRSVPWSDLPAPRFAQVGLEAKKQLQDLSDALSDAEHFAELSASETAVEFREKKGVISGLCQKLLTNIELESDRSVSLEEAALVFDGNRFNSNFAALSHEAQTVLLQLTYLTQKALLDSRRLEPTALSRASTQRSLLSLLRERESELQESKNTHFELQKKALLGGGSSIADVESKVSLSSDLVKGIQVRLESQVSHHRELAEKLLENALLLQNEMLSLQESVSGLSGQQRELATRLKKESSFARDLALAIEHETASLRGRYTGQILDLNQQVLHAREEESEKFESRVSALEKENHKKSELLDHFKQVVEGKEKTIARLNDHLVSLKLALHTHQKHAAAKKAFLRPASADWDQNQTIKKKKENNSASVR